MSTLFGSGNTAGSGEPLFNQTSGGISGSKESNISGKQPQWFQNTKRRTIPNHLLPKKKTGFHITSSATKRENKSKTDGTGSQGSGQFNLLSFGTTQRKALTAGSTADRANSVGSLFDTSSGDISRVDKSASEIFHDEPSVAQFEDDAPPSRSIYDLNDEVLISLDKPSNANNDYFLNKDPKNFNNVFNRDGTSAPATEKSAQDDLKNNPLEHSESAILVFGYPETMANQVISYFQEFGTILEDFEVTKRHNTLARFQNSSNNGQKKPFIPIFSGKSWVKLTYDNPSSALDALQENGSVFNGVLLGVIPYTKDAIEKLQKRKIEKNEDIGGGLKTDLLFSEKNREQTLIDTGNTQTSYASKLELKDGSKFFLSPEAPGTSKAEEEKKATNNQGLISNFLRFFFGFNEL
ncbi:Piso0_003160 [Millerozyma farinosa CBS 7064]|uniref:Piso0_003160 protein n=1 Tax=Pichia sorbitophila (strain ATCC MYA-4447 / BCRC 22081 / CBS 7064 / NBRC 10061 / NRRL Y-12695) TaxID=559304 RepID=G8YHC6_PICSO|nr:Piso0_003160 [Millerozyma farinosa CBS 7064]CCE80828.1 Piso0_003160 [Millerozyma farinosa CBS 7064]